MQMVLPSDNTTFTMEFLMRLACLLGPGPLSSRSWVEAVRGEVELSGEVVEPYNHVGLDYVRLEGDGGHGDVGMPLCFWTFVSLGFVPAGCGKEEGWWGRGRQRRRSLSCMWCRGWRISGRYS